MHRCENCGKMYANRPNLRKHKRHECGGRKEFICIHCNKCFTQKHNLQKHFVKCERNPQSTMQHQTNEQPNDIVKFNAIKYNFKT